MPPLRELIEILENGGMLPALVARARGANDVLA